ncbi:WD repeat-containing protein [Geopyxis carbonaria]|nr:WD repeat-containing protein [Geopyxis carbonaria]
MEESDYERQRQTNIAKNQELLKALQLSTFPSTPAIRKKPAAATPSSRSRTRTRPLATPSASAAVPRRTSSRLAGLPADSAAAKRKAADVEASLAAAESAKRARVGGELDFAALADGVLRRFGAGGEVLDEDEDEEEEKKGAKGQAGVREVREKLARLRLWRGEQVRVTPERVYHVEFYPGVEKVLLAAADKVGNLGILEIPGGEEVAGEAPPLPTLFKLHTRTISTFHFSPYDASHIISASYDSSIRLLNLSVARSLELYAPPSAHDHDDAVSGLQHLTPHTLLFCTLGGIVGHKDTRTPTHDAALWRCAPKKIGGLGALPGAPHIFATASLDRTVKLWDIRKMATGEDGAACPTVVAEHPSRLSVSSATFSRTGTLATTSYDDTIKLYSLPQLFSLPAPSSPPASPAASPAPSVVLTPSATIPHNNQTGRWVTIIRAEWQRRPRDGREKVVVANMDRGIDVFGAGGEQLVRLRDERISAVPAAAGMHPTREWVAGGTGSGKVVVWM